ncbi:hypothetical protein DID88_000405 [Monilinia fructigena]|uniref:Uncharacterized protein n=1 Tax=Monilinia fructigena TaxID=38457 RepID=A0A395IHY6_9HELO|nr:hypothetical protein DID88_000405 [Monilinia fructigena]
MKISPLPFQIPLLYTTQAANIFLKTIYQFHEPVHIENIHTRENGQLLLSTFANGTLFTIDPTAPNASATPIITLSHEPGYALTASPRSATTNTPSAAASTPRPPSASKTTP